MPFTYDCLHCRKKITKDKRRDPGKTFCSTACYHAATIRHPEKTCERCGATFRRPVATARFCSRACAIKAPKETKRCLVCAQDFTVNATASHRFNVCSQACRTAGTIYVECARCGCRFRGSMHRLDSRYCSEACRRPRHERACAECCKNFRHEPAATVRFCCARCYRRHQGETRPEAAVRAALVRAGIPFEAERKVGRLLVDFALPESIALEVDGSYWHRDPAKDQRRDARLIVAGWHPVHIREDDIRQSDDLVALLVRRLQACPHCDITRILPPSVGPHGVVGRADEQASRAGAEEGEGASAVPRHRRGNGRAFRRVPRLTAPKRQDVVASP